MGDPSKKKPGKRMAADEGEPIPPASAAALALPTGRDLAAGHEDAHKKEEKKKAKKKKKRERRDKGGSILPASAVEVVPAEPHGRRKSRKKRTEEELMDSQPEEGGAEPKEGSKTLFVGNLPHNIREEQLNDFFAKAGFDLVDHLLLYHDGFPQYGYAEFPTVEEAEVALQSLNDQTLLGRSIVLELAYSNICAERKTTMAKARELVKSELDGKELAISEVEPSLVDKPVFVCAPCGGTGITWLRMLLSKTSSQSVVEELKLSYLQKKRRVDSLSVVEELKFSYRQKKRVGSQLQKY